MASGEVKCVCVCLSVGERQERMVTDRNMLGKVIDVPVSFCVLGVVVVQIVTYTNF